MIFARWFLSSKTPRNFTNFTVSTLCYLISNLRNKKGRSCFLLGLRKREYCFSNNKREFICIKPFITFLHFLINQREQSFLSPYAHKKDLILYISKEAFLINGFLFHLGNMCHKQTYKWISTWINKNKIKDFLFSESKEL